MFIIDYYNYILQLKYVLQLCLRMEDGGKKIYRCHNLREKKVLKLYDVRMRSVGRRGGQR